MHDPDNREDDDEDRELTFEEVLRILEEELENSEEGYTPLNFNDDYRSFK